MTKYQLKRIKAEEKYDGYYSIVTSKFCADAGIHFPHAATYDYDIFPLELSFAVFHTANDCVFFP